MFLSPRFNFTGSKTLDNIHVRPVDYRSQYPNLNREIDVWDINFFTKAVDWEYAAEWRLVLKKSGMLFPSPAKITGIIFGLRMPDAHRREIIESVPSRYRDEILFYETEKFPGEFALKVNKIEI